MASGLDRDTRLVVVMAILIIILVMIGAMLFYFRKKENDALYTLFRLEDRMNALELRLQQQGIIKEPVQAPVEKQP